jgi:glutathione S-transferase
MLTLVQFEPAWGVLNASPFCMKVEVYCRLAKIPYHTESMLNPSKGPKGKLPFIRHDGIELGDSESILDYLEQKFSVQMDNALGAADKAAARAIRLMCEEHLYWVLLYNHWRDAAAWPLVRAELFGPIPLLFKKPIAALAQRKMRKQLHAAGMGRHSEAEIYAKGCADIHALSILLADQDYFCGAAPTRLDATVYAFLANVLLPLPSPVAETTRCHANLMTYINRMAEQIAQ